MFTPYDGWLALTCLPDMVSSVCLSISIHVSVHLLEWMHIHYYELYVCVNVYIYACMHEFILRAYCHHQGAPTMEAVRTSETSVNFNVTTRCYILQDYVLSLSVYVRHPAGQSVRHTEWSKTLRACALYLSEIVTVKQTVRRSRSRACVIAINVRNFVTTQPVLH
jgi:hypothetical protein